MAVCHEKQGDTIMTKKMEEALNAQINAELWSAYLYLSMAANFHAAGLDGIANWFDVQFKEEQDHAAILYNYMLSRDGRVILKPIDAVKADWATPLEAFEDTLEHEKKVTAMINSIYAIALDENDYATQNRMQWFIDEQVEEEESARKLIDTFRLIKDNGYALYMIDKELAARAYTQASPLATADK